MDGSIPLFQPADGNMGNENSVLHISNKLCTISKIENIFNFGFTKELNSLTWSYLLK